MMLDQLLDDEIDDDGEKNDELRPTNSSLPASDGIARRTDETVFLTHRRRLSSRYDYVQTAQDLAYPDKLIDGLTLSFGCLL
jgi:hypothetical protein